LSSGPGHHVAAWRDPNVEPDAGQSLRHYIEIAQLGERGRFDFLFNADSNSTFGPDDVNVWKRTTAALRLEPLTLMSALAAVTTHIGLVSTATTTYLEPFHVARLFASLDQLSDGRAGWNLVTSSAASEALNFSHAAHAPHSERYARAAEFVRVVTGLGIAGKTMPSCSTRPRGFSSIRPSCTGSTTRANTSRYAGP